MLFIFDMGGVITNTSGTKLFECVANYLGISLDEFYKFSECSEGKDSLLDKIEKGLISVREFWNLFSRNSGIVVNCDPFRLFFHPILNEETVQIVKKLKSEGHRVVCGTNTIDSHYDNHMARGDYSFFDMTYASIHMGIRKPDKEFYELILKCENEVPGNAFFTDDKIENIESAKQLGLYVHHFRNASGLAEAIMHLK